MSQFAYRAVVWPIVILLLLLGIFLQTRSAHGDGWLDHVIAPIKSVAAAWS
jgi:hypothetical protein